MLSILFTQGMIALTLFTALSVVVHASPAIIVPWNITVDEPITLTIDQRIGNDSESRQRFDAYRVYLALEPPGWGIGADCWLVRSVEIDTTQVNITIPADAAPDKSRIRISTGLYKTGHSGVNGYSYSIRTMLLGANGTWSQREKDGWIISDANDVSCWALGCARRCHERYYTGDKKHSYRDKSKDQQADSCVEQCSKDLNPRSAAQASLGPTLSTLVLAVAAGMVPVFS